MTMTLSTQFDDKKQAFLAAVQAGEPAEVQNELYGEMLTGLFDEAKKAARDEAVSAIAQTPAEGKLTAKERQFFNEIDKTPSQGLTKLFPVETVDRIFENLKRNHPLLEYIGLRNAGLRLKFIKASTSGAAEWGKVFDEIKGQLKSAFEDEEIIQNKLTAFVVVPKDAEKFGPAWLQSFVTQQIDEAFATALESAFLNGDGDNKPLGLTKSLSGQVSGSKTTYNDKAPTAVLTFADEKTVVKDLTAVHKHHSTDAKGEAVIVDGQVAMVVNPADIWEVKKQHTSKNAQGVFVTAMPFNVTLIESVAQAQGKVTTFVKGRYDAYMAGGVELTRYDQTFAIEDMNLYTAKMFAYGRARDEKAAAVWTLSIPASLPAG